MTEKNIRMTDSLGRPIGDDDNMLTIGRDGPALLEDVQFIDKIAHFARERIPERVVHAKGVGAFGGFVSYYDLSKHTRADFLSAKDKKTEVFVRFSTVIGGRGSADTVRDPRGFAVKFYTDEGIYDLAGNDLPVFFIRDAIKFPDVIHSLKPDPVTNMVNPVRFWDFVSLSPEATHMVTWLYSDRGTIKSYRHVDGFGVNTFTWINALGEIFYVKYHWKTQQGSQTINRAEAQQLAGTQPDIAAADLHDAIAAGDFPKWELCVQIMHVETADTLPFDPLDDTKTWPEDQFPLQPIGMMTLNRNPENFFAQVEQASFCPGNVVPGIGFSADKMLQGRSFSYLDAARHRIGTNFAQLPINRSKSPVANNQRDGAMAYEINPEPVNYSPNSLNDNQPQPDPAFNTEGLFISGKPVRQAIEKIDDFTQAGERYRSLTPQERAALCGNIAVELKLAPQDIQQRVLGCFAKADEQFAAEVRAAMAGQR